MSRAYFKSKVDPDIRWYARLSSFTILVFCLIGAIWGFQVSGTSFNWIFPLIGIVESILIEVYVRYLGYTITDTELQIGVKGLILKRVVIKDVDAIQQVRRNILNYSLSKRTISLNMSTGKEIVLAPQDQELFIAQLARLNPLIEVKLP